MKKTLGWTILIVLSLLPALAWFLFKPVWDNPWSYTNVTHAIGQLTGLVGMTLFALTFVLSARIKIIEDLFGGLDKMYKVHAVTGGSAFILVLLHPLFLVLKYIPENTGLAATYLIPGGHASVDYGIYALIGMILLLIATLYINLKYHHWKLSHKFLGVFFILASVHVFLIRDSVARDSIFTGYYIYAGIVSAVGIIAFVYTLFFKSAKNYMYKVATVTKPRQDVYDITLLPIGKRIDYLAGQFAFISFKSKGLSREAHPFSFASSPTDTNIRFVIKADGDYTQKLDAVRVGDTASVEGPYGRFFPQKDSDQVWLAAGIGITPFIGMTKSLTGKNKTELYYSVRNKEDIISLDVFKDAEKTRNFKLIPWVTSEKGRLNVDNMLQLSGSLKGKDFYLCGPKAFKESLIESLIKRGVSRRRIHEEEFSFK